MKRLACFLLICAMVFTTAALSEDFDATGYTYDELISIREVIDKRIKELEERAAEAAAATESFKVYIDVTSEDYTFSDKYDVELCLDDNLIATIPNGGEFYQLFELTKGTHAITFYKKGNHKIYYSKDLNITKDVAFTCDIVHEDKISIKNDVIHFSLSKFYLDLTDKTGMMLSSAKAALTKEGFVNVSYEPLGDIWNTDNWLVTSQSPDPASGLDKHEKIILKCTALEDYLNSKYVRKDAAEITKYCKSLGISCAYRDADSNDKLTSKFEKMSSTEMAGWIVNSVSYGSKSATIYVKKSKVTVTKTPALPSAKVPTATPTKAPTATPTKAPTATPTKAPTATPTKAPTATPTKAPTATPTKAPTPTPTKAPTATPTKAPTATPTKAPTATPTKAPTPTPTKVPTATPTKSPQNITVDNNRDFAQYFSQPDEVFITCENFVNGNKGKLVEFDGYVLSLQNHGNYKTRYDVILCGFTSFDNMYKEPTGIFTFTDVNFDKMHVQGSDIVTKGLAFHIIGKVVGISENGLAMVLNPISMQYLDPATYKQSSAADKSAATASSDTSQSSLEQCPFEYMYKLVFPRYSVYWLFDTDVNVSAYFATNDGGVSIDPFTGDASTCFNTTVDGEYYGSMYPVGTLSNKEAILIDCDGFSTVWEPANYREVIEYFAKIGFTYNANQYSKGMIRITKGCNARKTPDYGGEVIIWVDVPQEYPLVEEKNGWYLVDLPDGKQGYIPSDRSVKVEK